jgi:predicted ATPase
LWWLGYPEQALKRSRQGLTVVQELAHLSTTTAVWTNDIRFYQFLSDARTVQQRAEAVIRLCNEQGFPGLSTWVIVQHGWALAMQGQAEEGITQIHRGLAAFRATGAEVWRPYHLALLAEAYGKTGQVEEGLTALAEALAQVGTTGERFYEAELYRLKGTLTLQSQASLRQVKTGQDKSEDTGPRSLPPDPQGEAEACFHKAIEVARKQQAKSWELRASMSLARLWQQQGKQKEAHALLAEIYGWFTEGFDTKDLQEAKVLLAELLRSGKT